MPAQSLTVEEITDAAALEALREEWSGLWERCPSATPFQTPEWLLTWWRHFGNGSPLVIALRTHGRLAGLAPLFVFRRQELGLLQISLMGSGISDYLDFIIEPEIAREGARMVFEHLLSRGPGWDICDFQDLREGSPLLSVPDIHGLRTELAAAEVCTVLVLPDTIRGFRGSLSARFRKRLRYARNCLHRTGGFSIETAADGTRIEFLEALFRLHRAAWEKRGMSGVLADPAVQAFHRDLSAAFLKRGWLRLSALRVQGKITAVLYSFGAKGRLYCYLSGFDPGSAQLSPGRFILWTAIENAISEGMREVDFLRGREEYKYIWNPQERANYRLRAW